MEFLIKKILKKEIRQNTAFPEGGDRHVNRFAKDVKGRKGKRKSNLRR